VRKVSLQQHKDISLIHDRSMPPQPERPFDSASQLFVNCHPTTFITNGVQQGVQELAFQDNRVNTPENKNEERIAALKEQITSLKTQNSTLKEDVKALRRFTSSYSRCQLCDKVFKRSDGLRKHLRESDANHRRFFMKHYKTECKECGINFKDSGAYNRHMRSKRHALHVVCSAKVPSCHTCESRTTRSVRSIFICRKPRQS